MPGRLVAFGFLLVIATVCSAEPPSDRRVLVNTNVPFPVADAKLIKSQEAKGLVLPVPGLGFLPVPVESWHCTVFYTPPNAPAGTLPVKRAVRLFTWAE